MKRLISKLYLRWATCVDVLLNKLKNQAKIEAQLVPVQFLIVRQFKNRRSRGRHKKQTGGLGSLAIAGFVFPPTQAKGTYLQAKSLAAESQRTSFRLWIRAFRKPWQRAFLPGIPMVDINCVVFDGSYHAVDSTRWLSRPLPDLHSGLLASKPDPIILEPMADMDITVGEAFAGAVMGDISTSRSNCWQPIPTTRVKPLSSFVFLC